MTPKIRKQKAKKKQEINKAKHTHTYKTTHNKDKHTQKNKQTKNTIHTTKTNKRKNKKNKQKNKQKKKKCRTNEIKYQAFDNYVESWYQGVVLVFTLCQRRCGALGEACA